MYEIPIIEKLNTLGAIEDLLDDQKAIQKAAQRVQLAQDIEEYLQTEKPSPEQFERYCEASIQLLNDNYRLALYLPLEELHLDRAPAKLRAAYHRAWRKCWSDIEMRCDYTQGDIDPKSSIKEGQQIIKAFHLLPWLIRGGIIQPLVIDEIIELYHNNLAAMQALSDCICVFNDKNFFNSESLGHCSERRIAEISALRPHQPDLLYDEQGEDEADRWAFKRMVMNTHYRSRLNHAAGPFSANVSEIRNKICMIENTANTDEIFLLGGTRLKGYDTYASNFDAYSYDTTTKKLCDLRPNVDASYEVPNANAIHLCFNTIWVGIDPQLVRKTQANCAESYFRFKEDSRERLEALRTLEHDLLKHYLLYKGFPYCYRELSPECSHLQDIDGNSAFYDRRYRSIATCLFAKYIYIPQI